MFNYFQEKFISKKRNIIYLLLIFFSIFALSALILNISAFGYDSLNIYHLDQLITIF